MKAIRLLILIFFTLSTLAHAADKPSISNQAQENIQQMTQEMRALGIPEAKAQKMLTGMHQNRFQQQNIVSAQQTVMAAAKEGLPTEPIMNKAMEGMVKQAKEQQILKAMETVRNRHQYAYQMAKSLSGDKKTTEIMAGDIADCLTAGMSAQDMDRIAAQLAIQTRKQTKDQAKDLSLQTMQTVRTMARLGAMAKDVSDTVCLALQHQYTSRQMKQLRHNFASDTQQTSARQLARQYAGSIDKGENPGKSSGSGNRGGSDNGGGSGGSDSGGASGGSDSGGGSGGSDSGGGSGGSDSGGGSGGSDSGGGSGGSDSGGGSGGSDSGGGSGGSDSGGGSGGSDSGGGSGGSDSGGGSGGSDSGGGSGGSDSGGGSGGSDSGGGSGGSDSGGGSGGSDSGGGSGGSGSGGGSGGSGGGNSK